MSQHASEVGTEAAATPSILRLTYRSHSLLAGRGGETSELKDILRVSRINNEAAGVTGALMLYDDWFAQVLEGPEPTVLALFERIRADRRHDTVELDATVGGEEPLFGRWAMALVAEHHQPDTPLVATSGGLAQGAPWRVTHDQEKVLTRLRDLTRGYGAGS